jgi:predicted CXXCH cytochrome family protein
MKKALGLAAILLFVGATSAMAQGKAEISGTAHDFSSASWNPGGEVCVVCHTPHFATTGATSGPLWNHEETAVVAYTVYSSTTLNAAPLGQPGTESKTCLSCHDGTIALDSFGGATGTNFIGVAFDVETDLSDDHPVGFDYTTALSTDDGELADPSTKVSGLGSTITADMLFDDALECASCHDVHGAGGNANLLLVDNTGSALCLTCHGWTP